MIQGLTSRAYIMTTVHLPGLMLFLCWLQCASAEDINLQHLQAIYENSSQGEMPCYYDGTLCKRDEKYCSEKSKTCQTIFENILSEKERVDHCNDILQGKKMNSVKGPIDTCIYFFGKLATQKGDHFQYGKDDDQAPQPRPSPGTEFCPAANASCQLGNEICNATSRKCERIFPADATDDEKRQTCQEVIANKYIEHLDACFYTLGVLGNPKHTVDSGDSTNGWGITMTVFCVILAIAVVVLSTIICWYKKWLCFRQTEKPDPKAEGVAGENDMNHAREGAMQNLIIAEHDNGNNDDRWDLS